MPRFGTKWQLLGRGLGAIWHCLKVPQSLVLSGWNGPTPLLRGVPFRPSLCHCKFRVPGHYQPGSTAGDLERACTRRRRRSRQRPGLSDPVPPGNRRSLPGLKMQAISAVAVSGRPGGAGTAGHRGPCNRGSILIDREPRALYIPGDRHAQCAFRRSGCADLAAAREVAPRIRVHCGRRWSQRPCAHAASRTRRLPLNPTRGPP
jgi:hypothetical protein